MPLLPTRIARVCILSAFLLPAGCATAGPRGERPDSTHLTRAEIESVNQPNLYAVIQRLRPRWLTARGGSRRLQRNADVVVYQGQSYLGGLSALRSIGPDAVESAHYLDGPTASATLPGLAGRQVDGAILLELKIGP